MYSTHSVTALSLCSVVGKRTMTYCLKVHKHEIILNFFLTKIKSLYSLGKFSKIFASFPSIFARISKFEHTRNQIFLERSKNFFFKMFTSVLLDGFLNGFSKFGFFIVEICILMWDF
jgi:hypothetical protein